MSNSSASASASDNALGGTRMTPPQETLALPLRFLKHNFEANCYNTLTCSVIYDDAEFTRLNREEPSGAPGSPDYRDDWGPASYLGIRNFPAPAEVRWTSRDGVKHEAVVDIGEIFKDELAWHKVTASDYAQGSFAGSVNIYLEVNDNMINVYTDVFLGTKTEQIPGTKHSDGRDDLFLVWTRTY